MIARRARAAILAMLLAAMLPCPPGWLAAAERPGRPVQVLPAGGDALRLILPAGLAGKPELEQAGTQALLRFAAAVPMTWPPVDERWLVAHAPSADGGSLVLTLPPGVQARLGSAWRGGFELILEAPAAATAPQARRTRPAAELARLEAPQSPPKTAPGPSHRRGQGDPAAAQAAAAHPPATPTVVRPAETMPVISLAPEPAAGEPDSGRATSVGTPVGTAVPQPVASLPEPAPPVAAVSHALRIEGRLLIDAGEVSLIWPSRPALAVLQRPDGFWVLLDRQAEAVDLDRQRLALALNSWVKEIRREPLAGATLLFFEAARPFEIEVASDPIGWKLRVHAPAKASAGQPVTIERDIADRRLVAGISGRIYAARAVPGHAGRGADDRHRRSWLARAQASGRCRFPADGAGPRLASDRRRP